MFRRFSFVFVVIVLIAAACTSSTNTTKRTTTSSGEAQFRDCGRSAQCAEINVPLNYEDPDGRKIRIAMLRFSAKDPSRRIGVLMLNPGGPGASGVEFARLLYSKLPAAIQDQFDVVGFDPRGTGESTRVDCGNDLDALFADKDYSPDNEEEETALFAAYKEFVANCERRTPELLEFVGTTNAARDMDELRKALNEDTINYLGFSYGTLLGAVYADLFPDQVRAMVLDGAVDPSLSAEQAVIAQSAGFEQSLNTFFTWCAENSQCTFGGGDPKSAFFALVAQVDQESIPSADNPDRRLSPALFDLGVAAYLYDSSESLPLANALRDAANGDGSALLRGADLYLMRDSSGNYDGTYEAFLAINCVDSADPGSEEAFAELGDQAEAVAPFFGQASAYLGVACLYWPYHGAFPPQEISAEGAPPILVIGTTGDPATPFAWAEALANQLVSGALLTNQASGHTSFATGNNDCIDNAVVGYLVSLNVPNDLVCSAP